MQAPSLGLIETIGYVAAIEAADAGCKAANVQLLGYERGRAGLITVKFAGDVAAVRAAVTAGAAAAARVGKVLVAHVIARPHEQLDIFPGEASRKQEPVRPAVTAAIEEAEAPAVDDASPEEEAVEEAEEERMLQEPVAEEFAEEEAGEEEAVEEIPSTEVASTEAESSTPEPEPAPEQEPPAKASGAMKNRRKEKAQKSRVKKK
jgi:microcompartment protein CcmL/EutN